MKMFKDVYEALLRGECMGFAPEGCCRFLPYMSQPLKSGVARIALESVALAAERGLKGHDGGSFRVNIVPAGLVFTHREKFRSDVAIRYMEPIVVDEAFGL